MIRSAGLVILLVVAALFGAPSRAFAAQNSLLAGQVTPGSGTATTVFTFTVSYDGRFATTGVRTNVAGLSIPMVRVSGTSTAGTWSTASVLPPGTWQVTFRATTTQGNAPTLSGGTVSVAGGATPPPSSGGGPSPDIIPGPGPTPPSSEAPAPVATPAPSSGGTGGPTEPAATPPPTGIVTASPGTHSGAGPGSGPGGGTSGAPADASAHPRAHPSAGSGSVAEPSDDPERSPSSVGRAGSAVPGPLGTATDGLLGVVLVVGLSGVAAVAVVGSAFLLAGRRRAARPADLAAGDAPPTAASDAVEAALERRTLRRARMRLDDDPIVAAMGLGGKRPAPRRRAGQTGAGPGERPRKDG